MGDGRNKEMVPRGLEPRTLRLLAVRSSQLSYETLRDCFICRIEKAKTNRAMLGHVHNKASSIKPSQLGGRPLHFHHHLCLTFRFAFHGPILPVQNPMHSLLHSLQLSSLPSRRYSARSLSSWQQHRSRAIQRKLFRIVLA